MHLGGCPFFSFRRFKFGLVDVEGMPVSTLPPVHRISVGKIHKRLLDF
jgi:hypothetical protein